MATWRFGNPLAASFQDEEQTGFQELSPDAGVPFRRVRFEDIQNIARFSVNLSLTEYLDFKQFYRNETRQGTIPFDFLDCRINKTRKARFIGKPSYSAVSNRYVVSLVLSLEQEEVDLLLDRTIETGSPRITENGRQRSAVKRIEV